MLIKPKRLQAGNKIAAVSLSWGGPAAFPQRYKTGKRQFEKEFELEVIEMQNTLANPDFLRNNPKARADDLMQAFADKDISGIVCTIGGDDSINIIPFIDSEVIRVNPKAFIGYSDATVTHLVFATAGLRTFYGPTIMTGFAENMGIHRYSANSFRRILFQSTSAGIIEANMDGWTDEYLDWSESTNQLKRRQMRDSSGWSYLQGTGTHQGRLIGGCIEVFDWFRGTKFWPTDQLWEGAILFLETSEEAMPSKVFERALRVYAMMGVLSRLKGILFGRPGGRIDPRKFNEYDDAIVRVVRDENGLYDLPVITRMDFGHTDPIMTLPIGALAEIDCDKRQFRILESAVED
jgi:muramoyltetrapeptide carboxypeptidase LdcA involved in peptidoglycan recycling